MDWWLNITNIAEKGVFAEIESWIWTALAVFLIYRFIIKPIMDFLDF